MIVLDGIVNGFAVMVTYINTKKKRYLVTKEGNTRLFNNLEVAKTVAKTVEGVKSIEYFICVEGKMYPLNKIYKLHNIYVIVDKEANKLIKVAEKFERKASNFFYIACENGANEHCDKQYGQERIKELFALITQAIELCFVNNFDEYSIDYTEKFKNEFTIHLRNCTSTISICTNSVLMDINQDRKENGEKAYPFIKSMDKFLTFYVIISRDITEPIRINSEEKAIKLLNDIVDKINFIDQYADAQLVKVDSKGYLVYSI